MTQPQTASPPASPTMPASSAFRFTRLQEGQRLRTSSLAEAMGDTAGKPARWLFVSPHDDDLSVGAGLLMQAAVRAGVDVQVLVVTDGCLGYCLEEQRERIVEIRQEETYESFQALGIPRESVTYIGYPDGGLVPYIGRRRAGAGEAAIAGYVGLQNALTYYLRKFRPARVFVPTHTDLHPDHRIVNSELMISLFHASGAIWPELGPPLESVPKIGELAVYCAFSESPNLEIVGDDEVFQTKLRSIQVYRSQLQIADLVESLRRAGPYEYVLDKDFGLFTPECYKGMFA